MPESFMFGSDLDDTSDDGAPDGDPSTDGRDPKATEEKRIRDLQSKADKETARANQAEARLKAMQDALQSGDPGASKPPTVPAALGNETVLEMARMFTVQQFPKLAEYGLGAKDLTGSTPAEIARSATELVARFERVETQVRNKVLADAGLTPSIGGGAPPPPAKDYASMTSAEFKIEMDRALSGRRS